MYKGRIDFILGELSKEVDRPLNILMTSTHPMTDKNLAKIGHNIYNLDIPNFPIKWQTQGNNVPSNMHIIKGIEDMPCRPDVILSQNIVDQYNSWINIAFQFDCPVISFEHTLPTDEWISQQIPDRLAQDLSRVPRIFISDFSKESWKCKDIKNAFSIYHMIDTDEYNGWIGSEKRAMLLVNQFTGREWAVGNVEDLLTRDVAKSKVIDLYGHNAGFNSRPLSASQVIETLRKYSVFINTSLRSPLPASLLEAAAVGIPIVSTKTCAIPKFFEHSKNILFYENYDECLEHVDTLLNNRAEQERLGAAGREVILQHFNKERYTRDWNNVLQYALENYHV